MCKMTLSDSGKMKRDGISVSLEVEFNDDYDEVVKKAAEILQLSHVKNLHLFRLRGTSSKEGRSVYWKIQAIPALCVRSH